MSEEGKKKISEFAKKRYANSSVAVFCKNCGKQYRVAISRHRNGRGVYCSRKCQAINRKGIRYSVETEFKKGHGLGSNNINWKGDNVTKESLHTYINRHFIKPKCCEICNRLVDSDGGFEWSNRSQTYKTKDRSDWQYICKKCHNRYDDVANKAWETKRAKLNK